MQIAFISPEEFPQVSRTSIDVGARIVEVAESVYPQVVSCPGPEYLHDAMSVGTRTRRCLEIALTAGDGEQQRFG